MDFIVRGMARKPLRSIRFLSMHLINGAVEGCMITKEFIPSNSIYQRNWSWYSGATELLKLSRSGETLFKQSLRSLRDL